LPVDSPFGLPWNANEILDLLTDFLGVNCSANEKIFANGFLRHSDFLLITGRAFRHDSLHLLDCVGVAGTESYKLLDDCIG
jgi:hypothetical protein